MRRLSILTLASLAAVGLAACQQPAPANNTAAAANVAAAPAPPAASPTAASSGITSPDADGVKAFIASLYAHYKSSNSKFDVFGHDAASVFDPDTRSLMKAETKALKGEVGTANDGDPLCLCQDFESVQAEISVQSASADAAKASAQITDPGIVDGKTPREVDFDLTKTAAGWRIHDIHSKDEPSFRDALAQDIKDGKAGD